MNTTRSNTSPLAAPADGAVLETFCRGIGLPSSTPLELERLATAFARLPYENLTKVIRRHDAGRPAAARRGPDEVVSDHLRYGAGGTCFSLTAALLHLIRAAGWRAEPILADRHYGSDTHCAVLVWIDARPHVIDPGYLITRPLPLDGRQQTLDNGFNQVILRPQPDGHVALHTVQDGQDRKRLTFKTAPVDAGQFLHAWDASFDWDMMRYPLLSRMSADGQYYIQDHRLQVRCGAQRSVAQLSDEALAACIVTQFGMDAGLVHRALGAMMREGGHG